MIVRDLSCGMSLSGYWSHFAQFDSFFVQTFIAQIRSWSFCSPLKYNSWILTAHFHPMPPIGLRTLNIFRHAKRHISDIDTRNICNLCNSTDAKFPMLKINGEKNYSDLCLIAEFTLLCPLSLRMRRCNTCF